MNTSEREELEQLQQEQYLNSLGDRPHGMAAYKLKRLIELRRKASQQKSSLCDGKGKTEEIKSRWAHEIWYRAKRNDPELFNPHDILTDTEEDRELVCSTYDDSIADLVVSAPKDIRYLLERIEALEGNN